MLKLDIIIVGAGIAGLSMAIALQRKGHHITVLERHPSCQALGGPVALGPSATRVLPEFGLEEIMTKKAMMDLKGFIYRRYDSGTVLGRNDRSKVAEAYGFSSMSFARFRLQEILAEVATERGVKILFGSSVQSIDQNQPAVLLKDGVEMKADLIVGTDGIRAVTRDTVLGEAINTITYLSAYSIDIPRGLFRQDPSLSTLLDHANIWVGPGQMIFAGNMPDHGDKINFCFASEEPAGQEGEWYTLGDLKKLAAKFAHFDPTIAKVLDLADPSECYIWRLSEMPPLPRWVSESGRVVLAGDSAHAMLPYVGMGASSCIEDSACLAECLDRADSVEDIPKLLQAYEQIRKPRAEWFVRRGRSLATIWHLPDGERQQKRDRAWGEKLMALPDMTAWDGKHIDEPPAEPEDVFHPLVNPWISAYDVVGHTRRSLDQILS